MPRITGVKVIILGMALAFVIMFAILFLGGCDSTGSSYHAGYKAGYADAMAIAQVQSKPSGILASTATTAAPLYWSALYNPNYPSPHTLGNILPGEQITALSEEAHRHGLHWDIFFDGVDYQADAAAKGKNLSEYSTDRWMVTGKTKAEAAYNLFIAIQGKPTHPKCTDCSTISGE